MLQASAFVVNTARGGLADGPELAPTQPLQDTLDLDLFELRRTDDESLAGDKVRGRNSRLSLDPIRKNLFAKNGSETLGIAVGEAIFGSAVGESWKVEVATYRLGLGFRITWAGSILWCCAPAPANCSQTTTFRCRVIGSLGVPGQLHIFFGLLEVAHATSSDVSFVSAAAGAVGPMVLQIAKYKGMEAVASAGSDAKCRALLELGADASGRAGRRSSRICPPVRRRRRRQDVGQAMISRGNATR
jgi:NADPH-dependent curcumin reductase CurA